MLAGGPAAAAALKAGAFSALVEQLKPMFPFFRQDTGSAKVSTVTALSTLAASSELCDAIVETSSAGGSGGDSAKLYALPLGDAEAVVKTVVRSLWGVVHEVYQLMTAERTGRGKFVDAELTGALTSTAAAAAAQLVVLADSSPGARSLMKGDMKVGSKISVGFLQAIKDPGLYGALIDLRKILS